MLASGAEPFTDSLCMIIADSPLDKLEDHSDSIRLYKRDQLNIRSHQKAPSEKEAK